MRRFSISVIVFLLVCFSGVEAVAQWAPVTRNPFIIRGGRYAPFRKKVETFKMARVGFGIPYGCFGVSGEIGTGYLSVTGGAGYFVISRGGTAPGWSVGVRGYLMKDKHGRRRVRKVRLRAGAYYSVHGVYSENGVKHVASGLSFSFGLQQRVRKNVFYDMDLNIIMKETNSFRPQNKSLELPAFPSIGIGWTL